MARGFVPLHLVQASHAAKAEKKQIAMQSYRDVMAHAGTMEEKGLRRLILPEYRRPFIQALSKAAGKIALQDLKSIT